MLNRLAKLWITLQLPWSLGLNLKLKGQLNSKTMHPETLHRSWIQSKTAVKDPSRDPNRWEWDLPFQMPTGRLSSRIFKMGRVLNWKARGEEATTSVLFKKESRQEQALRLNRKWHLKSTSINTMRSWNSLRRRCNASARILGWRLLARFKKSSGVPETGCKSLRQRWR